MVVLDPPVSWLKTSSGRASARVTRTLVRGTSISSAISMAVEVVMPCPTSARGNAKDTVSSVCTWTVIRPEVGRVGAASTYPRKRRLPRAGLPEDGGAGRSAPGIGCAPSLVSLRSHVNRGSAENLSCRPAAVRSRRGLHVWASAPGGVAGGQRPGAVRNRPWRWRAAGCGGLRRPDGSGRAVDVRDVDGDAPALGEEEQDELTERFLECPEDRRDGGKRYQTFTEGHEQGPGRRDQPFQDRLLGQSDHVADLAAECVPGERADQGAGEAGVELGHDAEEDLCQRLPLGCVGEDRVEDLLRLRVGRVPGRRDVLVADAEHVRTDLPHVKVRLRVGGI